MIRHSVLLTAVLCGLTGVTSSVRAADMTAEQSAMLYDLLTPLIEAGTPKNVDPKIFKQALQTLRDEKLLMEGQRPNYKEKGLLDKYGKALFMGGRAKEFAADIAHIHDLVAKGDPEELKEALRALWVKAGRKEPDDKALQPIIDSLYGTKGAEPQETVRYVFDKAKYKVEVVHARAGGRMQVNITAKGKDGEPEARTVIQGVTETVPTEGGGDLERRVQLDQVCTNTVETDVENFEQLAGEWLSNNGSAWTISGTPQELVLSDGRSADESALQYQGTYALGRLYAEHRITHADDVGTSLPLTIRSQIAAMGNQTFRTSLETCGERINDLSGTWSSQHVTYGGMTMTIKRIHDPYDLSLTLKRNRETDSAQGAAEGISL